MNETVLENHIEKSEICFSDLFVECTNNSNTNILQDINTDIFKDMSVTHGNIVRLFRHFIANRESVVRPLRTTNSTINYFTDKEDRAEVKGLRNLYSELKLPDPLIYQKLRCCSVQSPRLHLTYYNLKKVRILHNLTRIRIQQHSKKTLIEKNPKKVPIQRSPKKITGCMRATRGRPAKTKQPETATTQSHITLSPLNTGIALRSRLMSQKSDYSFHADNPPRTDDMINNEGYCISPTVTSESEFSFNKSPSENTSTMSSDIFPAVHKPA